MASESKSAWGTENLKILLIEGRDLAAKDRGKSSDPYALIWVGKAGEYDQPKDHMIQGWKSDVVKKNLNPQWNQEFGFSPWNAPKDADTVHVQLYDKNTIASDEYLGHVVIPLLAAPPSDEWLPVQALGPKHSKSKVSGEIRVKIEIVKDRKRADCEVQPSAPFTVILHSLTGTTHTISDIPPDSTLLFLKERLQDLTGQPPTQVYFELHPESEIEPDFENRVGQGRKSDQKKLYEHGIIDGIQLTYVPHLQSIKIYEIM